MKHVAPLTKQILGQDPDPVDTSTKALGFWDIYNISLDGLIVLTRQFGPKVL